MNTTVSFTRYRSALSHVYKDKTDYTTSTNNTDTHNEASKLTYNSGIQDCTLKSDFDYTSNVNHNIKFGGAYTYHTFSPDATSIKMEDSEEIQQRIDTVIGNPKVYAHETLAFIEDNIYLGKRMNKFRTTFFFISCAK